MIDNSTTYYTDANASCLPPSRRRDSAMVNKHKTSPNAAPSRVYTVEGNSTRQRASKGWPPKRRLEQAARCRAQTLWQHSTGPKTTGGKARSAQNAVRHNRRSALYRLEIKRLRQILKMQRAYRRQARLLSRVNALQHVHPCADDGRQGLAHDGRPMGDGFPRARRIRELRK